MLAGTDIAPVRERFFGGRAVSRCTGLWCGRGGGGIRRGLWRDRGGRDGDWGCAEHDWAGPERIGAGRAPRLREGGLSAADTATGRGTPENDLQGPEAAPRSRGPGRADDAR